MIWVFMVWAAAGPSMVLNAYYRGEYSEKFTRVTLRRWAVFMAGMLAALLIVFCFGFPAPGDMRDLDDGTGSRIFICAVIGVGLGVALSRLSFMGAIFRLEDSTALEEAVMRLGFLPVRQAGLVLATGVASVRGFERTALGAEYHWWLVTLAFAELFWMFFAVVSRKPPDRTELKVALAVVAVALTMFLVQPLRFDPSWVS